VISTNILELLGVPSVTLIIGKRGSGKSSLGHKVLELAKEKGLSPYLLGFPEEKSMSIPSYITLTNSLDEIPDNAAVFLDESYMYLFSRESFSNFNKAMAKFIGVSRQKNILLVFATHLTRKLDVSCIYDADNLIFRQPSYLHLKFEREEIKSYIHDAADFFSSLDADPRRYAYIVTEKGVVKIEVELPSYWSEDISKSFSGISFGEKKLKQKYKPERCYKCRVRTEEYLVSGDTPFCFKCAEEIGNKLLWSFPKTIL